MEPHYIVIAALIGIIVIGQVWIFLTTLNNINLFNSLFPFSNKFKTLKAYVPEMEIANIKIEELFKNQSRYSLKPHDDDKRTFTLKINEAEENYLLSKYEDVIGSYEGIEFQILLTRNSDTLFAIKSDLERLKRNGWSIFEKNIEYIEVTLVQTTVKSNRVLDKILNSINTYLLRNKGAVSDFNLIKDIVERNCDAEDEQINTLLPIPLYLGLMGTMLGIIVGVGCMAIMGFNSVLVLNAENKSNGIEVLMGAVGVAMISSFIGLFLTTLASGWFYKGAKGKVEQLKNDFYTFVQTELLPSISNSATNSIITLQNNLLKFNEGFTSNVTRFDSLLTQILSSFTNQMSIVQELKEIDIAQLARLNINVLRELKNSTIEFEKFNQYIHQVNSLVSNATELNDTLKSDLADIENRKYSVQQAFTKVNDSFEKGLIILKESTDERLKNVQLATLNQQDSFEKYLKNSNIFLKEITDNDKGVLVDLLNQNNEVLIELKKQSELRLIIEKIEGTIAEQNKTLSFQNQSFSRFNLAVEGLTNAVKELSVVNAQPEDKKIGISKAERRMAYFFMGTGAVIGIGFIVYKLVIWAIELYKFMN
ncbi:MAG: hypothetical protein NTY07_00120 [Bacteroidia bacterium]|nr:hypothetical protein [Bacteroidia bacterium]